MSDLQDKLIINKTAENDVSTHNSERAIMNQSNDQTDYRGRFDSVWNADEIKKYTDDDKENDEQVQKKNAENRYGKNIKGEYKVSNTAIMVTIIIGIFLIPS